MPRTKPAALFAGIVAAVAIGGCGGRDVGGTSGVAAAAHPCAAAVAARLQQHGVVLAEMTEVRWLTDRFAREGGARGPINTITFIGRPPTCERGSVQVTMWGDCGVQNVRARGGCELPGRGR